MTEKYDVIIIGGGASGLASAWHLVNSGLKVACFEQGDFLNKEDFISIEEGGELQRYSSLSYDPNVRKNDFEYNIDSSNSPINIANFNGVGGSTVLYSAQYPRFHESDFSTYSLDGVGADWPISYSDLKKYYELDQELTGVAGVEGDPFYKDIKNLLPPVPLAPMGKKIAGAFESLGWHWWPAYSAIATVPYDGRPSDNYSRPSNIGDFSGSKGSSNHTYLPKAIKKGLILKTNCIVIKLESGLNKIKKVHFIDANGSSQSAISRVYILAASGIGTPRLLLNSSNDLYSNGLANSSGLLGKNLMLHPLGYVEGYFKDNLYSNIGPQGCCLLSQEFYETRAEHDFKRGYTFQVLRGPLPVESSLSLIARKKLKLGSKTFIDDFLSIYNHTAHMTIITEDFPEASNKIELDWSKKNKFNQPGISINYQLSHNSKRMLSHGLTSGRRLLKEAGAYKTFAFGPVRSTGWHIMGTCKMGEDPKDSIVNKFGKCHDIENLFIVDSSIFPSSSGVNPASTIHALSLYISDNILKRYSYLFENINGK